MQTVEIVNVKMAKFRLDYIVEPTVEGWKKEKRSGYTEGKSWAEGD